MNIQLLFMKLKVMKKLEGCRAFQPKMNFQLKNATRDTKKGDFGLYTLPFEDDVMHIDAEQYEKQKL